MNSNYEPLIENSNMNSLDSSSHGNSLYTNLRKDSFNTTSRKDSFDAYRDSRLNGISGISGTSALMNSEGSSDTYTNSTNSGSVNSDDSHVSFLAHALSYVDTIISNHNPFQNEYSDNNETYDVDNAITFNTDLLESKSYQRAHYIKEIQYELFLYLSLMSVLFMLCTVYLKKYYFIVPFFFCAGTLYGVYAYDKFILQYSTIISILVDISLILVIIIKGLIDWNYMMFVVSSFMSVLYTMILFRQLQFYYYIPPSSNNILDKFYRCLCCR